jgi:hypothetical protein
MTNTFVSRTLLSRIGLALASTALLVALLAAPAAGHEGRTDLGIDAVGVSSATRITLGRVVVRGAVTCSKTARGVWTNASVRQVAGRTNTVSGSGSRSISCVAGQRVPFSITITPRAGKFVGGKAVVSASAYRDFYTENNETWHYHWDSASTARVMKLTR